MNNQHIPEENKKIYCSLYSIENCLRELIIELLERQDGPLWYKRRLPSDLLKKYKDGLLYEKKSITTKSIPHHSIYYLDFPDLKKIIENDKNWTDVFGCILKRKDILSSTLAELEPIRNKIAHNRKATCEDVAIVNGAFTKIFEVIGKEKYHELIKRCTSEAEVEEIIKKLGAEAEMTYHACTSYKPVDSLEVWDEVSNKWWFDASFLNHEIDGISDYFKTIKKYSQIPRNKGTGHKIEAWVKDADIDSKYSLSQNEFSMILNERF